MDGKNNSSDAVASPLVAGQPLLALLCDEQRWLRAQMKRTQGRYGENKRLEQIKKQIAAISARKQEGVASVSASAEGGSHSPNSPAVLASKGA